MMIARFERERRRARWAALFWSECFLAAAMAAFDHYLPGAWVLFPMLGGVAMLAMSVAWDAEDRFERRMRRFERDPWGRQ